MNSTKRILLISLGIFLLAACGGQTEPTLAIPEETSGPTPSIEIIAGPPDTCTMADTTQSTVIGFDVIYHNVGTDAFMVAVMSAPDVGEIGAVGAEGEGREGEGSWGIYPQFYDLPANTAITLEITVHAGFDESAPVSSASSITYDCSTGETISTTFNLSDE